jgi:uncharacterized protein with HEPN domain
LFSEREQQRLHEIVDNADAIAEYLAGVELDTFRSDRKTIDAVERCLQRISEAVIQIGAERMSAIDPAISSAAIRGLGNFLRHEYFRVDLDTIYRAATRDVPMLRVSVAQAMDR